MAIVFNNTVYGAGFVGSDDGAPSAGFGIDDVSTANITVSGTVNAAGDTVQATGIFPGDSASSTKTLFATQYDSSSMIQFTDSTTTPTTRYVLSNTPLAARQRVTFDSNNTPTDYAVVCFVTGTRIRVARNRGEAEVPVEELRVGDGVVTASGEHRPVRWIGHRTVACTTSADPNDAWPVRIKAGAIATGVPARDLLVSPDHCLLFDDVLIPAKHLVNAATIVRQPVESVGYWHIELDSHEALLAEGTPAESYRDCGMHAFFEGGQGWGTRPADAATPPLLAPHALSGPRLHAVKAWLIARAKHLGAQRHDDPDLELVADGRVVAPSAVENRRFTFAVPAGTQTLILRSRSSVPAHWIADNEDPRLLGVRVSDLRIDGAEIAMSDASLSDGWNAVEPNGRERWTNGNASLPPCRSLSFAADWFLGYPAAEVKAQPARIAEPAAVPALRLVANG
ncbi:Hint domain-containing protein [Methylobacterium sp. ID0610]|uniref:Hint domain-containing protein n=1 Tax=Methylobacterium carpenticola TaxID=3344827 RepID=UPI0036A8CEA6